MNDLSTYLAMLGISPEVIAQLAGGGAGGGMPTVGQQPQLAQQAQGIGEPAQASPYAIPDWMNQGGQDNASIYKNVPPPVYKPKFGLGMLGGGGGGMGEGGGSPISVGVGADGSPGQMNW